MKIAIAGTGYVGLSIAVLLSVHNNVVAYDIIPEKVDMINNRISPIKDALLEDYLKNKDLHLTATNQKEKAYKDAEFIIVATPTNYDEKKNSFDTSKVENVIEDVLKINQLGTIVIKSTIPVGYVNSLLSRYETERIFFSPEFLREGKALYDNLYPSRIVIGAESREAHLFAELLKQGALKENIPVLFTQSVEAEAIKLFANTYLALRISFFNEVDTYCELKHLNAKQIIQGIGLDPRIGNHYNNPSFGYGGDCLPKDTKQLKANFEGIPNDIINAVVSANDTRKKHIAHMILEKKPSCVGIYRLAMKKDSDNFRMSAIQDVIDLIKSCTEVVIYEPSIETIKFMGQRLENNFQKFIEISDLIIANRVDESLYDVRYKVYTRDIYERD